MSTSAEALDELIDVVTAARQVGRHPETVRRWIWSGRLTARRQGRRLVVARSDLRAIAGEGMRAASLQSWRHQVAAARTAASTSAARQTAADLIIEDRLERSGRGAGHAGR